MRVVWTLLGITCAAAAGLPAVSGREECTSAVLSPAASATGGAVLWKNRDTDVLSNKVVFVDESPHDYVALVNHDADSGRQAWTGLNSAGFAILNTVAYNLPDKPGEMRDLEGILMGDALRTCATVEEFERYLQANLGPDLGALTTFGVLDAGGRAFLFEVHNHGFVKHDAALDPRGYLVNTNFARSGEPGAGAGYLRFERATELFAALPGGPIDPFAILTRFSRDVGHVLLRHPEPANWKRLPADPPTWIDGRHTIDRPDTSAAVVILGRNPSDPGSLATMWVIPGEPLTAIAVPLWVESGRVPEALWQGDKSALWEEARRVRSRIRPFAESDKEEYLVLSNLDNAAGTGYLPGLLQVEDAIVRETREFLRAPRTAEELAAFQDRMAAKALAALRAVP